MDIDRKTTTPYWALKNHGGRAPVYIQAQVNGRKVWARAYKNHLENIFRESTWDEVRMRYEGPDLYVEAAPAKRASKPKAKKAAAPAPEATEQAQAA